MKKYAAIVISIFYLLSVSLSYADDANEIDYELAFVRDCGEYCLYYVFDIDDNIVRYFSSSDTGVMCGTFTFDGSHTLNITWASYWQEQFIVADFFPTSFDRMTGAFVIDVYGESWTYGHTEVEEALSILNQPDYHDIELE